MPEQQGGHRDDGVEGREGGEEEEGVLLELRGVRVDAEEGLQEEDGRPRGDDAEGERLAALGREARDELARAAERHAAGKADQCADRQQHWLPANTCTA